MKLKGLVWFFTIVLIVISLWQLSYTFAIRSHESKVLEQAEKLLKKSNPALKGEDFNAAAIVKQKRILDSTRDKSMYSWMDGLNSHSTNYLLQ